MFVTNPNRTLIPTLCFFFFFFFLLLLFLLHPHLQLTHAKKPHTIAFRSPGLYPEAMAWDPSAQHFLVGSLQSRSIHAVFDAGVVEDLICFDSLPPNSTILCVAVDRPYNHLLTVVHSIARLPPSLPSPLTTTALGIDSSSPSSPSAKTTRLSPATPMSPTPSRTSFGRSTSTGPPRSSLDHRRSPCSPSTLSRKARETSSKRENDFLTFTGGNHFSCF